MNEAKFSGFLQSVCEDHKLSEFGNDGEDHFKTTIYCKIQGEDYDTKCGVYEKIHRSYQYQLDNIQEIW